MEKQPCFGLDINVALSNQIPTDTRIQEDTPDEVFINAVLLFIGIFYNRRQG